MYDTTVTKNYKRDGIKWVQRKTGGVREQATINYKPHYICFRYSVRIPLTIAYVLLASVWYPCCPRPCTTPLSLSVMLVCVPKLKANTETVVVNWEYDVDNIIMLFVADSWRPFSFEGKLTFISVFYLKYFYYGLLYNWHKKQSARFLW